MAMKCVDQAVAPKLAPSSTAQSSVRSASIARPATSAVDRQPSTQTSAARATIGWSW